MAMILGAIFIAMVLAGGVSMAHKASIDRAAAKAGAWEFLDKDRERRHSRAERRAAARAAFAERRRQRRAEAVGGDGSDWTPGFRAYAADLYRGFWEDALNRRHARRDARDPFDPSTPTLRQRVTAMTRNQVNKLRRRNGDPEVVDGAETEKPEGPEKSEVPTETEKPGLRLVQDNDQPTADASATEPKPGADYDSTPDNTPDNERVARIVSEGDGHDLRDYMTRPHRTIPPINQPDNPADTAATTTGETMTDTTTEVVTNADLRRNLGVIGTEALAFADAMTAIETARAKAATAAAAASDAVNAKRFDSGATNAAHTLVGVINTNTLSDWSGFADAVAGEADQAIANLNKYFGTEGKLAATGTDATTLANAGA